jgi:predicted dehydrogenase
MRLLVLGLGFFGQTWLREIQAHPDCEVAGVLTKHADVLAAVGDKFNIPPGRRYTTLEESLKCADAQAVVVALPEMLHRATVVAALDRGLHVLTEKPLAMDTQEAGAIVTAARRARGIVVMVSQNYRWQAHALTLRRSIAGGRIGRLTSARYESRESVQRRTREAWREQMPHPFLHDTAIHHFDILRAWTGQECVEVMAVAVPSPWSWYWGLPTVEAILTFDQGLIVNYTGTMVARGLVTPKYGLATVVGEDGTLRLEADQQVRWYRDNQVSVVPQEPMPVADTAYALKEFLAAIREGRLPETHLEDNVRSLAMTTAAIASTDRRQPVAVAPFVAEALGG